MNSVVRREKILEDLKKHNEPIKGQRLAEKYGVTRQVIVKDVAIMKAKGEKIISTPAGYTINHEQRGGVERIIAVHHKRDRIYDELKTIIKYGGEIKDVIIEHPLYGEINASLRLKNLYDIEKWMDHMEKEKARPLSALTDGIHLHTVCAPNEEALERIIEELHENDFIINENE